MTIYIDAWLECDRPRVMVKEKRTERVIASFDGEEINNMLDNGDACVDDFFCSDVASQLELVKALLLIQCKKSVKQQIESWHESVISRLSAKNEITLSGV